MERVFYSASQGGFYLGGDKALYEAAGTWPDDAMEISQRWYEILLDGQSKGSEITVNDYGQPVLTKPVIDHVAVAESERLQRINEAAEAIAPLQDAADLGIATDAEEKALSSWKLYRVMLNRLDVSTAPDIEWPETPQDVA
ncbi:tail fiber assembly protein [Enterobacter kobei]|uniref:tail fiber assembly protein n=1 Tax=Enterobacter TaxID=547 RepID=UPI000DCC199D|nr:MULTISPECIES: tail fiber assembly protein [Enterobacter]ELY4585350.1 tail fiber assembly protein [Cronobacter sakazakii]ELY5874820.1 tail fiber assembly protein [Cronobacter sakazakii]RAY77107.1 tail fiber assembly protein [Enterobacter kobei]RGD10239.1 tail fiber assembly protein [Enterobacter sp. AM17-18]HBM0948948.1 tail fiber assembly protein [Enterobacter kobei]